MPDENPVSRKAEGQVVPTSWGELNWKITDEAFPGSEMTFGTCVIRPGERNQLHSHPTCEEILYVVSGSCEHKLGDAMHNLEPGDAIRIPRNVRHWARNVGSEPLVALIFFSSGKRTALKSRGCHLIGVPSQPPGPVPGALVAGGHAEVRTVPATYARALVEDIPVAPDRTVA